MKELYLIPKHQFELLKSKKNAEVKVSSGIETPTSSYTSSSTSSTTRCCSGTSNNDDNNNNNNNNIAGRVVKPKTKKIKTKKIPKVGEQWRTMVLPPPLQKPIHVKGVSYNRREKKQPNFNIRHDLAANLAGKALSQGRLILDHLEKSGHVEWDRYGDIFQPINGYNIIDIIKILVDKEKQPNIDVDDIVLITNSVNLPLHYIKNKFVRRKITGDTSAVRRGRGIVKPGITSRWENY